MPSAMNPMSIVSIRAAMISIAPLSSSLNLLENTLIRKVAAPRDLRNIQAEEAIYQVNGRPAQIVADGDDDARPGCRGG